MANHVTTEWHDIQVKMGNYVPITPLKEGEEYHKENMELMEGYEEKKAGSDEDSDPDFRDDSDGESEAMKQYRQKRLDELKEKAKLPRYGYVKHITKEDYVIEVNDAPKDVIVVVVLYQDYLEYSLKLVEIIEEIAKKHVFVKFLKSIATKTIPDFADAHCPGMLIYKNGEIIHQLIPALPEFGGKKMDQKIVEFVLGMKRVIDIDLDELEDPRDELYRMNIVKQYGKEKKDDESDEEDRDTRGYLHNNHWASYKK